MTENRKRRSIMLWSAFALVLIGAAAGWYLIDTGFRAERAEPEVATDMPQDEFERRVRDYILSNPEIVIASLQGFEARQREAEASEAQSMLESRVDQVFRNPDSPVGGNPEGDVTLVEFFDYNCPYCRQVAPVMAEAEAANPELRIVYKEFPILGPGSAYAAKAALAAHRQGRYVAFHQALMQYEGSVDENAVEALVAEVGLDVAQLKADIDDPAIQAMIDRNIELAQALRINGTPGFVVGEEILRGATDLATLQALIEQARVSSTGRRN